MLVAPMIALFFEVTPKAGEDDRYLQIAASLRPHLDRSGGCNFLERYRSLIRPRTMLSHQVWADEASLARWRANGYHHGAQCAGRSHVFEDYRLRVGPVVAETGEGGSVAELALGDVPYNDPARVAERYIIAIRSRAAPWRGEGEPYRSVYDADEYASVAAVASRQAGLAGIAAARCHPNVHTAFLCLVSRDYGMRDRSEAPQYFPVVA